MDHSEAKEIVRECSKLSDEGETPFGEIVKLLTEAGVERYHADLARMEKTYYWPDGTSEAVTNDDVAAILAPDFSAQDVAAAVRAAQSGHVKYPEFCRRVMAAGCAGYHVHITGQRVVYYGRKGDNHVEWFPGAKPSSP